MGFGSWRFSIARIAPGALPLAALPAVPAAVVTTDYKPLPLLLGMAFGLFGAFLEELGWAGFAYTPKHASWLNRTPKHGPVLNAVATRRPIVPTSLLYQGADLSGGVKVKRRLA